MACGVAGSLRAAIPGVQPRGLTHLLACVAMLKHGGPHLDPQP